MTDNSKPIIEFDEFPKIARLSRDCIITEKIDGTNAQIHIVAMPPGDAIYEIASVVTAVNRERGLAVLAGSRSRYITPVADNFGFAAWVKANADALWALGEGRHFGEWWGSGIQRGYGLPKGEKRFSLFNVTRWCLEYEVPQMIGYSAPGVAKYQDILPACCHLVPVFDRCLFTTQACEDSLERLRTHGSAAAPGFTDPEGIVCFHVAANVGFKKTLLKDEAPKSL